MCNIYVNYNRKPNKHFLFRWIRRTGNTCFVVIASLHCYMARAFSSWCRNPGAYSVSTAAEVERNTLCDGRKGSVWGV